MTKRKRKVKLRATSAGALLLPTIKAAPSISCVCVQVGSSRHVCDAFLAEFLTSYVCSRPMGHSGSHVSCDKSVGWHANRIWEYDLPDAVGATRALRAGTAFEVDRLVDRLQSLEDWRARTQRWFDRIAAATRTARE